MTFDVGDVLINLRKYDGNYVIRHLVLDKNDIEIVTMWVMVDNSTGILSYMTYQFDTNWSVL